MSRKEHKLHSKFENLDSIRTDVESEELKTMLLNGEIMLILNFKQPLEISYLHLLELGIKKGINYATTIASAKAILSAFKTQKFNCVTSLQSYYAHVR